MKWTKNKSFALSQVCIVVFAVILLAMDVRGIFEIVRIYGKDEWLFMISLYSMSVCGWICLWALWRLMGHLKKEMVFVEVNVRLLRLVSWCCAAVAIICLLSCLYFFTFFVLAVAAAFMMLIVRIVKNIFQQAIAMKSELDLTI